MSVEKKQDLVPTMNFRRLKKYYYFMDDCIYILQQQFLDRNIIKPDGTCGGEQWVDVPEVTE